MLRTPAARTARGRARTLLAALIASSAAAGAVGVAPAAAWNVVTTANGDNFTVNDAAIPGLDTGSVHNTATGSLQGYGGIRMRVQGGADRLEGILLRGFGLKYDGVDRFASQDAVQIDGIAAKRGVLVNKPASWIRYFDSFTNTTKSTQTVEVAFGGQLGFNQVSGTTANPVYNQSRVASTSSGDTAITAADGWFSVFTPNAATPPASSNGPSATTIGTAGFAGALSRTGNFLRDPFTNAAAASGDEANHYGLVNRLVIPPKQTRSLAHFVVTGLSETRATPTGTTAPGQATQVTAVQSTASSLSTAPALSDLSTGELCTLANYNLATLAVPGFSAASCPATQGEPIQGGVSGAVTVPETQTTSPYDVVGKTITDLTADMTSGRTTAQQITRAYLDRIAAYDTGPLGLHSVLTVAPDAMAQAKAADAARAAGDKRPLLGIPILAKDIYDTKDMPTTGGSLIFDGYRPTKDAFLVARLRDAGAIILGKANLSEFANDGSFSSSAFGQVWNAFDTSRSPIGSSGGSGVAVASSFAAAALGTQTGDSLWGPSTAASTFSLRGTDGMQSTQGVMPLTYIQDYAGVIAQSAPDMAVLLDATAVGNPQDPLDDVSDGHRPASWGPYLRADALQGKVIGVPATAFNDPFGTTGTSGAQKASFANFVAAGATVKDIPDPPAAPTNPAASADRGYQGWYAWIQDHPDNPYTEVGQITRSPLRIPQFRNVTPYPAGTGPNTDAEIQGFEDFRAAYRARLTSWMDDNGVDAVVFPGALSDIHLNDSIQTSFGRKDPQASAAGVPTSIFPAGVNDHGQPIILQLEGRPFSDPEMLAYAYAYDLRAKGRQLPLSTSPRLTYNPAAGVPTIPDATPAASPDSPPPAAPAVVEPAAPVTSPVVPPASTAPPVTTTVTTTTTAPGSKRLTLASRTATADRRGRFTVQVGCASSSGSCTGTLKVRRGGKLVLSRKVTVQAGKVRVVRVQTTGAARRALSGGRRLSYTIGLTGTGSTGVATGSKRLTVRP